MSMEQKLYVKDIMTRIPLVVGPEDSVVFAAKLLYENGFSGLPVVDGGGLVQGVLTDYDLISKGESLRLPTLINILGNIDVYKKDSSLVKDDLARMMILKVKEVMNTDPLTVEENASIQTVAELFAHHHRVNPILAVDKDKKLKGVVSRSDLIRFFADENTDRQVETSRPEILDKKVKGFIGNFEGKFASVSRVKAKLGPMIGLIAAVLGFTIAFALILKVMTK